MNRTEWANVVLYDRGAYLLLWVAVLFVIFQTPLILSRLWESIDPLDLSRSQLTWTEAASPTRVTEMRAQEVESREEKQRTHPSTPSRPIQRVPVREPDRAGGPLR